jgi:hypothetical protein
VPKLKDFVFAVTDESNKQLVNSVIEAFTTQVEPLYPQFSKGTGRASLVFYIFKCANVVALRFRFTN